MAFLHHHEPSGAHLRPVLDEPVHARHELRAHERALRLRSTLTAAGDRLLAVPPPCVWDDRCWYPGVQADAEQVVDLRDATVPVPDWTA
ncbi:MAG TPA: hypothetical protein VIC82_01540 [Candidatus Nanopelagicales bacterium]|jgi:hypothetical protein